MELEYKEYTLQEFIDKLQSIKDNNPGAADKPVGFYDGYCYQRSMMISDNPVQDTESDEEIIGIILDV